MPIPPHRVAGETGHIEDHNAIADVLTGNDQDIADVTVDLAAHKTAPDPHGDRAYTDNAISTAIAALPPAPVNSVNGYTGTVNLVASDVGAETPSNVTSQLDALETSIDGQLANKVDTSSIGANNGVAPLDGTGKVPVDRIPSLTGSQKLTVGPEAPSSPNSGDVWVDTDEVNIPLSGKPGVFKSVYEGPVNPLFVNLPSAGSFGAIPNEYWGPIVFQTGPTGYTEISVRVSMTNNATDISSSNIAYSLSGSGVSVSAGFATGAYQSSRGFGTNTAAAFFVTDPYDLPPNTTVTLSPFWRLSTLPLSTDQNGATGRYFRIETTHNPHILVKAW